jgi:hypothetical protein
MTGENTQYKAHVELLSDINMLRFENWPEEVDIRYSDENSRKLCEKFSLDERRVIRGFRKYKTDREDICGDLKPLLTTVSTIAVSTN